MNDVYVENLSGVKSPTFKNKLSDDTIGFYRLGYMDLKSDASREEVVACLSCEMDCNPDGWLVFVESKYSREIKDMLAKSFQDAYKNNLLNFDNGELSEMVLFYNVDNGIVIEMVDPECGSDFFNKLIECIKDIAPECFTFELCHMATHLDEIVDMENGSEFMDILNRNNINRD